MVPLTSAIGRLLRYPPRWFRQIIRIQESRPYSTYAILLFCLFVGIARLMGEWFIGARTIQYTLLDFVGYVLFYWYSFFTIGLILFVLVKQPWRKSINVVLIGIFLGVLPPVFDLLIYEIGTIRYSYYWAFPRDWSPFLYNPRHHFHFGETLILWLTVVFTALYVRHKTDSWGGFALGALLAYIVLLVNGAVVPSTLQYLQQESGWAFPHLIYMMLITQTLVCVAVYLLFQPALRKGLLRRAPHAMPFVVMSLLGAAFTSGTLNAQAIVNAGLILFIFLVALVQNDFYDAEEDSFQGRKPYVDAEDVRFMTISAGFVIIATLALNSMVGAMYLMIFGLSFLYSYPLYRGKQYFPSNLKMEGSWGLAAFLSGMLGALEHGVGDVPKWEVLAFTASPPTPGWPLILACVLVFGGHSLLAILKDYKDVSADAHARIQTLYTLALRRGVLPARVHAVVSSFATLALALPLPLLYSAGKIRAFWFVPGILIVVFLGWILRRVDDRRMFTLFLLSVSGYLAYLLLAMLS
jgi:hypothetical protein